MSTARPDLVQIAGLDVEPRSIDELRRAQRELLAEVARHAPADVDAFVGALVAHIRAWRPETVAPLGVLPAPTEAIRDPRGAR